MDEKITQLQIRVMELERLLSEHMAGLNIMNARLQATEATLHGGLPFHGQSQHWRMSLSETLEKAEMHIREVRRLVGL